MATPDPIGPTADGVTVRRLLEATPAALLWLDASGRILGASSEAEALLGRTVRGTDAMHVFADLPALASVLRSALRGVEASAEIALGPGRPVAVRAAPCDGGVAAVLVDQRPLAQARNELRFVDALVESLPLMVFVKDARELRFVRFNRAGEALVGHRREDLVGRNDYDFFPKEEADFFTSKDREVLREGRLVDVPEEAIHTPHRGVRLLRTLKVPVRDDRGQPIYLLGISEDITEARAREREVDARLRELERLRTELVANASHELRTPITLIVARTERMLARAPAERERAELEAIEGAAQTLAQLVDDLLDVSRLDAGHLTADYARVDLARLVRATASAYEVLAERRGVRFVVETPPALPADVDPGKLRRAVENLLANAFRYAPRGEGVVRVSLVGGPDEARIEVADNGPGVPEHLRERVFERFFQVPGDPRAGAAGIGLALVREFAALHGGTARVGAAREGGAWFAIDVPLVAPPGEDVRPPAPEAGLVPRLAAVAAPPTGAVADVVRGDRPLVLVAEDHPDLAALLVQTIAEVFDVVWAPDGQAALDRAEARRPDLVLTDLVMPRMDGEALVGRLKAHPDLADVPVVVLTARADEETRVRLLQAGAQDYVSKPFSSAELLARLGNLIALGRARELLGAELKSTRRDVDGLAEELVRRARSLREALDLRDDFVTAASHELRTPLTPLVLALQAMVDGPLDGETLRHTAELALGDARRLSVLVDELLDATHLQSGRPIALAPGPCDLRGVAERAVAAQARTLARAGCEVSISGPAHVRGTWDGRRLEQVVTELLSNAVRFGAGRPIALEVGRQDGRATLAVRDHGIGIPQDQLAHVFERFGRAGRSVRHYGGLGLGLYVGRSIVEAHGGTISVESRPGGGSTFTVRIPA